MDLDHIEPHGTVEPPSGGQENLGHVHQTTSFSRVDRFPPGAEPRRGAEFDLDENHRALIERDQIDLPGPGPEVACYDRLPPAFQPRGRTVFPPFSRTCEALARMRTSTNLPLLWILGLSTLVLAIAATLSLLGGMVWISFHDFPILFSGHGHDSMSWRIVSEVRAPRVALAVLSGMGLAVSGGVWQGMLCNPLADPYLLGITSGASLGAALALGLGAPASVSAAACAGGLLTVLVVLLLSQRGGGMERLVLIGLSVSAFTSAGLALVTAIWPDRVAPLLFWMMGGFSTRSWGDVQALLPWTLTGLIVITFLVPALNLLQLGDERARSLGVAVGRTRLFLVLGTTVLTASTVAQCGAIGFVGLMVPHAARLLAGADLRRALPVAAILGGILVVLADLAGRLVWAGGEIPAGIVTALLGGPVLLTWFIRGGR